MSHALFLPAFALLTSDASALAILPNPIPFTTVIQGEAHLVSSTKGLPSAATLLEGAVAESDTTLVFRIDLLASSSVVDHLALFAHTGVPGDLISPTGAGSISGAGVAIVGASRESSTFGERISFQLDGGFLDPAESTDLIFVSYPNLSPGNYVGVTLGSPSSPLRRDGFSGIVLPEPPAVPFLALACLWIPGRAPRGERALPRPRRPPTAAQRPSRWAAGCAP